MRITKVNIPKSFEDNGIEDIKMDRPGKIVLLAGKNGSGKTRLLNKIRNALTRKSELSPRESITNLINKLQQENHLSKENIANTTESLNQVPLSAGLQAATRENQH